MRDPAPPWLPPRRGTTAPPPIAIAPERARAAKLRCAGADLDEAKEAGRAFADAAGWFFFEDGAEPAQFDGAAAAPLAVALREQLPQPVVLIVTGRNVDEQLWRRAVESPDSFVT